ncbi:MAG: hypothetical protein M1833_007183 [Piccolia ochrophora]|nr:MAG: hypothetical protein M1833_007183 [Piccolia ochrophora]
MRFLCLLSVIANFSVLGSNFQPDLETPLILKDASCDCTGTNNTGPTGKDFICRDPRLGPRKLPRRLPMLSLVTDYDRFAGLTPGEFLEKWTRSDGTYLYPPHDGFELNTAGQPVLGNITLKVGAKLDRFGSEYGSYVSAADAPFAQRALPPSSLATNPNSPDFPYGYHVYSVIKPFDVLGGPIAPWFGQPGLGAQFYTGRTGNIIKLINEGYIRKVNKTAIDVGPGHGRNCGQ